MSGTTDHSESAGVIRSDSRHRDPDTGIVSESRGDDGVARDPRDTLIMKQNIDAYFRSSRKRIASPRADHQTLNHAFRDPLGEREAVIRLG